MEKNYYVYEYYTSASGEICINNLNISVNKGDVFYVGKGTGRRVSTGIRNMDCEKFKKQFGWEYRIVRDNLTEEEAFTLEKELIANKLNSEIFLTNKTGGNSSYIDDTTIGFAKYLIKLNDSGCVKMSQENIALETETYTSFVSDLCSQSSSNQKRYEKILPKCPDNIEYILEEYDAEKQTDRDIKFGNIKYLLNLLDNGMVKMTQSDIAKYYDENPTTVSAIKNNKYSTEIKPIKPNDLSEILIQFDIGKLNEVEIKEGTIKYILDQFVNTNILKITYTDLVGELQKLEEYSDVTYNWLQDLKRRKENIRHVKPSAEILGKLFYKYHEITY